MNEQLKPGVTANLTTKVGAGNTISLNDGPTVFSTPSMIRLMEYAARKALEPHLAVGEESVGIDVHVTHTSATPPRAEVTAEATVTSVEKNVVSFDVVAHDAWGEIGKGTHRRAVIKAKKMADRIAQEKPISVVRNDLPATSLIDCKREGSVLRLVLNRSSKRNAMNQQMTHEMEAIVQWLSVASDVHIVIVRGSGENFSAGDDVGDLPEESNEALGLSLRRGSLFSQIATLPQVFVAAIDGLALGGGLVLASACDIRIATLRAKLGLPEAKLGWLPNYGNRSVADRSRTRA